MSKSKHSDSKQRRRRRQRRAAESTGGDPLAVLLKLLIGALLVGRLLVPTEGSVQGDTLWMAQLWLAAGLLWTWNCWREGEFSFRWDRLDTWLWVLVLGHVVSALAVVVTEGQKRAALNMMWEWVALGVSFFLLRQILRTRPEGARLVQAMVAVAAVLAALGIYQHYVWYPQTAREYENLRNELDHHLSAPPAASAQEAAQRQLRVDEIQSELSAQGIPLEGPARELWEDRLRASREPFGMFALANTFAGLLLVWLIVALGLLFGSRQSENRWRAMLGSVVAVALMAFCLVLTKSRTAWAGLAAGLVVWGSLRSWHFRPSVGRKWLIAAAVAVALAVGAVFVAAETGGLDRAVLTEAPKSLRYRVQYWTGASKVAWERPLLGTGPGNFRQHYLKYKAPESSEEIADPHNFILDVWTSGGLIGLGGLLGLIVSAGRRIASIIPDQRPRRANDQGTESVKRGPSPLAVGAAMGFPFVIAFDWLLGAQTEVRLLVLGGGFVPLMWLLGRGRAPISGLELCLGAAGAGLLVHLLGAGGIEMPAITQMLLVLLAVATIDDRAPTPGRSRSSGFGMAAIACSLLALFIACLMSATLPVANRKALVKSGDLAVLQDRNVDKAERLYRTAAEKDPFSPEPAERLAELAFRQWQSTNAGPPIEFEQSTALKRLAISLDPHNAFGYRQLGLWWLAKFERTKQQEDAEAAVERLAEAVERYPNLAALRAERARALQVAGRLQQAASEAARALQLDRINRAEGHRDKYLPEPTLEELRRIGPG